MSRNKSVSLFEILPPSGDDAQSEENAASPEVKKEPVAPPRKRVDSRDVNVMPDVTSTPEPKKAPAAEKAAEPTPVRKEASASPAPKKEKEIYSHNVEGVSVREKNDYFVLIVAVLLSFSVITGLFGYKYGKVNGIKEGKATVAAERSNNYFGVQKLKKKNVSASKSQAASRSNSTGGVKVLPVSSRSISTEQRNVMYPKKVRKYGVLLERFSPSKKSQAKELVAYLRSRGIDAYADKYYEYVYAGRFTSSRDKSINNFLERMKAMKWKSLSFSDAYKVNIPSELIK